MSASDSAVPQDPGALPEAPSLPLEPDASAAALADSKPVTEPAASTDDEESAGVADAAAEGAAPGPKDMSPAACSARLAELFPALFVRMDARPDAQPPQAQSPDAATPGAAPATAASVKPIKLRVHADIHARAPGVFNKRTLGIFFSRYTTTNAYLKALLHAQHRYDLDGQACGEIADEHRQAAAQELERRRSIAIEKRASLRGGRRSGPSASSQGVGAGAPRVDGQATDAPAAGTPLLEPREHAAPGRSQRPPRASPRGHDQRGHQERHASPRPDARRLGPRPDAPRRDQRAGHFAGPSGPVGGRAQGGFAAGAPGRGPDPRAPREPQTEALPVDPARRERALLLRAFEGSTLTKANFCALKRMSVEDLDAQLAQARTERNARN